MLRVRTRPECPEGNQRELLSVTNLNCGTAKERQRKLTGSYTLPAVHRTKGPSKSRGASQLRTGPAPPEAGGRRQGGGERGKGQARPQGLHPLPHCKQASSF